MAANPKDPLLNTPKVRGELQQVASYWEKQKNDQERAFKRAHRQLSDRLVQLAVDQELSRQETEKLQELLEDLEDIESEPSTPGIDQIKNIIKRHACVDQCRLKIEELIRKSYHTRHAPPVELANYRADIRRTSAHELAVAKMKEKKKLLHQHAPAPGGPYSISHKSLASPSGNLGGQSSAMSSYAQIDNANPSTSSIQRDSTHKVYHVGNSGNYGLDDNKLRKMAVSSSLWGRGGSGMQRKEDTNGHTKHLPSLTNNHAHKDTIKHTPSEERLINQRLRASLASSSIGNYHPVGMPPSTGDRKALSRASMTRHSDGRFLRRRTLAMESLMNQLYEYRAAQHSIHPKDLLSCRYLRLTPSNVAQLEHQCHDLGRDPGIHAHMTEQQVTDHFDHLEHTRH